MTRLREQGTYFEELTACLSEVRTRVARAVSGRCAVRQVGRAASGALHGRKSSWEPSGAGASSRVARETTDLTADEFVVLPRSSNLTPQGDRGSDDRLRDRLALHEAA